MNIKIETQVVGNGSYGIQRDFDPIAVFHVHVDDQIIGTYATKKEAQAAIRKYKRELPR
jgi:hypothetical protein